jgi:hypothetical protein
MIPLIWDSSSSVSESMFEDRLVMFSRNQFGETALVNDATLSGDIEKPFRYSDRLVDNSRGLIFEHKIKRDGK